MERIPNAAEDRKGPTRRGNRLWLTATMLVSIALLIAAIPKVGEWVIRHRILPARADKLGFNIEVASVRLDLRSLLLTTIRLSARSAAPRRQPTLRIAAIKIPYRWQDLFRGRLVSGDILIERPQLDWIRSENGQTNLDLSRFRRPGQARAHSAKKIRIGRVTIHRGKIFASDQQKGVHLEANNVHGYWRPGASSRLEAEDISIRSTRFPATVSLDRLTIDDSLASHAQTRLPTFTIGGGNINMPPGVQLSAIAGTIQPEKQGTILRVDLKGSYGGAQEPLWTAEGTIIPMTRQGTINIETMNFDLGRIASFLHDSPIIDPHQTSISGRLRFHKNDEALYFGGQITLNELNIFHPSLARRPLRKISSVLNVDGHYKERQLVLNHLRVDVGGLVGELRGSIDSIGRSPKVSARFQIRRILCQKVLAALPRALVSDISDFRLKGYFDTDLSLSVDYQALEELTLQGKLGLRNCQVVHAPPDLSADRLAQTFETSAEPSPENFLSFVVGPENPDFAPYSLISPHVIDAFLTTEDISFFRHRGFLLSHFRRALAKNLKHRRFRVGASTISMQLVKNVLLSHERTLARKLQELFLVWYLEQELTKERLMEIYLNVIEFGPGIYGIGRAARHFFGKDAVELTPREAAFFSSILPNPRGRYIHYCRGRLSASWQRYVNRILLRMKERGFLDDTTYAAATSAKLHFARAEDDRKSEKRCIRSIHALHQKWQEARRKRLKASILNSAPDKLRLYLPEPRVQ